MPEKWLWKTVLKDTSFSESLIREHCVFTRCRLTRCGLCLRQLFCPCIFVLVTQEQCILSIFRLDIPQALTVFRTAVNVWQRTEHKTPEFTYYTSLRFLLGDVSFFPCGVSSC